MWAAPEPTAQKETASAWQRPISSGGFSPKPVRSTLTWLTEGYTRRPLQREIWDSAVKRQTANRFFKRPVEENKPGVLFLITAWRN
jgi:hypothetical protein